MNYAAGFILMQIHITLFKLRLKGYKHTWLTVDFVKWLQMSKFNS